MVKAKVKEPDLHQLEDVQIVPVRCELSALIGDKWYPVMYLAFCSRTPVYGGGAVRDRTSLLRDKIPIVFHEQLGDIVWGDTLGIELEQIKYRVVGRL